MTGPLAPLFAQVRDNMFGCVLHWQGPILGCDTCRDSASALAALSVIERHVQDMASLLDEISMKPYRAEEIVARYRERKP